MSLVRSRPHRDFHYKNKEQITISTIKATYKHVPGSGNVTRQVVNRSARKTRLLREK